MELEFDITRGFEKDLRKFSSEDRKQIENSNKYAGAFDPGVSRANGIISRPQKLILPEGFDSTLFVLGSTQQIRVILAIDNDPLFGRRIITLLRAVDHDHLDGALKAIAESLYQNLPAGDWNLNGNG